jgi:hypothetical protein
LSATSCEVLNIDIVAPAMTSGASIAPIVNIKYCRDQSFRTIAYELVTDSATPKQAPVSPDSSNERRIRVFQSDTNSTHLIDVSLSNSLCTKTFNGSTAVLP